MPDISHSEHPNLYRAIKKRRWLKVQSMAFRLRAATEWRPIETALSVIVTANCTKKICQARQDPCFGEFVLETAAVTSRWRVELTQPNHAKIHGLPLFGSDEVAIEDAASDFVDLITDVQLRPSQQHS